MQVGNKPETSHIGEYLYMHNFVDIIGVTNNEKSRLNFHIYFTWSVLS